MGGREARVRCSAGLGLMLMLISNSDRLGECSSSRAALISPWDSSCPTSVLRPKSLELN